MAVRLDTPLESRRSPDLSRRWPRLLLGLVLGYGVFEFSARALGSDRGQMGLVVGALVVAVVVCAERVLFRRPWTAIGRELGLGAALLLVIPVFLAARGAPASPHPGWPWLLPGLFAQAGVAEETLFRGYLFRHVRQGRTFGRAALGAAVPFVAVHLAMFLTLPWPIALASVLPWAVFLVPRRR